MGLKKAWKNTLDHNGQSLINILFCRLLHCFIWQHHSHVSPVQDKLLQEQKRAWAGQASAWGAEQLRWCGWTWSQTCQMHPIREKQFKTAYSITYNILAIWRAIKKRNRQRICPAVHERASDLKRIFIEFIWLILYILNVIMSVFVCVLMRSMLKFEIDSFFALLGIETGLTIHSGGVGVTVIVVVK